VLKGAEYFINGDLNFPQSHAPPLYTNSYRMRFGPCVEHNGLIYCECDPCFRLAVRRLTGLREPLKIGFDAMLFRQQKIFVDNNSYFINKLKVQYTRLIADHDMSSEEIRMHYADAHPKAKLRIQAYDELINTGKIADDLYLKSVWYKMKKDEWAKPGKYPRGIGDLGVAASLQGFRPTEFLKHAMDAEQIEYAGGYIEFCKSVKPTRLTEVFKQLLDPPGRFYFVCFSDDACLSFRLDGKIKSYNIDISSCDSSHGASIFKTLIDVAPDSLKEDFVKLVNQCRLPMRLISYDNRRRKVLLAPKQPILYSGSTITTCINNLASILICCAIVTQDMSTDTKIIASAQNAGYIITLEHCERPCDLQFLKHSPIYDEDGLIRPVLNIGVLLRLSGTCKGDVPGQGRAMIDNRYNNFQQGLLRGAYPRAHFTLLDYMTRDASCSVELKTTIDKYVSEELAFKVEEDDDYPHFRISDVNLYERYRLDGLEIQIVNEEFGKSKLFEFSSNPVLSKILMKDYGLSCV